MKDSSRLSGLERYSLPALKRTMGICFKLISEGWATTSLCMQKRAWQ
jgi:hypothetical protein